MIYLNADADMDKTIDWAVFGRHWNGGQGCVSSKRMIVVDEVYDTFLDGYRKGVAKLVMGDPSDPGTTLAPLSSQKAADDIKDAAQLTALQMLNRAAGSGIAGRLLGQVHQRAGVGDEPRADELADHDGEVGRDGAHAVLQVLPQLRAVLGEGNHLVGKHHDIGRVLLRHLCAHRNLGGLLHLDLDLLDPSCGHRPAAGGCPRKAEGA